MSNNEYKKVPTGEHEKVPEKSDVPPSYGLGIRHIQSLIFFLCLGMGYFSRAHLGVTIVAMTNPPNPYDLKKYVNNDTNYINESRTTIEDLETNTSLANLSTIMDKSESGFKTFDWPKSIQEMALSSFFLGYMLMMCPIGMVCQRFGGKVPLQIALLTNAVVSFLTPWLVTWGGWKALCACRIIQGLSQSGLFPGLQTALANWVPLSERGTLSSFVFTGAGVGTVVSFQLAGVLASSRWGWPSVFWASGIFCTIGLLILTIFGSAKPDDNKAVSDEEMKFIMSGVQVGKGKCSKVPWKAILTSKYVWATICAEVGLSASFIFFLTQVPTYMYAILKVNIKSSGLLSSLPYIACTFTVIAGGYLSDYCTNKNIISLRNGRRISNSIASFLPSICLAVVSFTTNTTLAVTLFVLTLVTHGLSHTGWVINYTDLAPRYAGTLMSIGNVPTYSMVLVLPVLVSHIVTDTTNPYQWRVMLFIISGFTVVMNLVFIFFMSADVQPWNDFNEENDEEAVDLKTQKASPVPK